jgi:hypothetical protein
VAEEAVISQVNNGDAADTVIESESTKKTKTDGDKV